MLPKTTARCIALLRLTLGDSLPGGRKIRLRLVEGLADDRRFGGYGAYGTCSMGPKFFHICLDQRTTLQVPELMNKVLCHEFAHALTWETEEYHEHGEAWGLAFALCWRTWLQEGVIP